MVLGNKKAGQIYIYKKVCIHVFICIGCWELVQNVIKNEDSLGLRVTRLSIDICKFNTKIAKKIVELFL